MEMACNQCVQVNLCFDEMLQGWTTFATFIQWRGLTLHIIDERTGDPWNPCLSQLLVFTLQLTGDGLVVIQRLGTNTMERSQLVEMSTATEGNGTSCSFRFLSKVVASLSSNAWAVVFEKNADLVERNSTEYSIDLSGLFVKILLAQSRIPPQHGKRRLCSRALERSRASFVFGYTSRKAFLLAKWLVQNSRA